MTAAKLIVLLAGVLGVTAFFLPLASFHHEGRATSISGYQVFTGISELEAKVETSTAIEGMTAAELGKAKRDLYQTLSEIKDVVLVCFVPGGLLAVIGLVAVVRGRFGRLGGTVSLLLGAVALLVFVGANRGVDASDGDVTRGPGLYLLLATGILGVGGGLIAAVSPDHGSKPI
jgi:hypothetical protein